MLLKVDASQLEWRTKVFLSQDKIGIQEILDGKDFHSDNQTFFTLPSRLIAKIFVFRMIFADAFGDQGFAGPAWSYANDAEFQAVSKSTNYWEQVVTKFFEKYKGIHEHSISSIKEAVDKGILTVPSGRFYLFAPRLRRGILDWPRSEILNYPVQGFSADLMQVARLIIYERMPKRKDVLLINTVHDDVELDVDNDPYLVYTISILLEDAFKDIPKVFEQLYGSPINVPMAGEVKYGMTLDEESMHKFNRKTFFDDWKKFYG